MTPGHQLRASTAVEHCSALTSRCARSRGSVTGVLASVVPVVLALSLVAPASATAGPLLQARAGGDGDSWTATNGITYRIGLINTPEISPAECFGAQASAKRTSLTSNGFRARVYTTDSYGRKVALIALPNGTNLGVYLARYGYANDRYLAQYRHEYPSYAKQLDAAFAAAKRERRGLWGACGTPARPAPAPAAPRGCHPDYTTCIPIKGNGSGQGQANDLDCPDIRKRVLLRQAGRDPYRLDADRDGYGCDNY